MGATETLVQIRCLRALLFGAQGAPRHGRASAMLPPGAEATHRAASQERSVRTEWPEGAHGRGGGCSAAGSEREQVGAGKEQAGRAGAAARGGRTQARPCPHLPAHAPCVVCGFLHAHPGPGAGPAGTSIFVPALHWPPRIPVRAAVTSRDGGWGGRVGGLGTPLMAAV